MPSGKPRKHGRNPGGRPSNKERLDDLHAEINTLRQLLYHRKLQDETWHMIHRLLTLINELDDLATPQRAAVWEGPGHSVEPPILPGVAVTDRGIVHAGTYAANLNKWFHRQVRWTIATTENRLKGKEADPRPRMPRRETSNSVKDHVPGFVLEFAVVEELAEGVDFGVEVVEAFFVGGASAWVAAVGAWLAGRHYSASRKVATRRPSRTCSVELVQTA